MNLVAGTYDVTASKINYTPQTVAGVVVQVNQTTVQNFKSHSLGVGSGARKRHYQ
jgi:hypothetical protein